MRETNKGEHFRATIGNNLNLVRVRSDSPTVFIDELKYQAMLRSKSSKLHFKGPRIASRLSKDNVEVRAPMPGLVSRTRVVPGAAVSAGTRLIVVEAIKMENEAFARSDGRIVQVYTEVG